jgi:signal peptide peptidase SppA, 67K type
MKAFFASFIGTLLALFAFAAVSVVLLFGGFAILASLGEDAKQVRFESGSYLVLNLDGTNLTDAPPEVDDGGFALFRDAPATLPLRRAVAGLRHAARDPKIRGVFVTGTFSAEGYGTGFAALEELRAALASVNAAGKPVKAYFDEAGTSEIYLASVAQDIVLNPFGLVVLPGLAAEPMFYGEAFEKWGVGVQVTRSGKYKGAIEPFVRRDLSPENREQLTVLLNDLWASIRDDIAGARGMEPRALQALVDEQGLITPDTALEAGLVTAVAYRDEILDQLRAETGTVLGEPFRQVAFADYLKHVPEPGGGADHTIAVVYAEGEIVDGEGAVGEIGGAAFARELRALREDDNIAAVVLRVNSPGGSASAAEEMLRELRLLREVKPVVVSMGSYAASGGYWISAFGERVFVEPTTITGSIGVFGVQFDVQKLGEKIGFTWDRVQTGEKAGLLTIARPKTPGELAVFQRLVDHVYEQFIERVAEGRNLEKRTVHEIAQGRVWSGGQAVKLGLADEIGGLGAAIAHAAKLAAIDGEPAIQEYPSTRPLAEALAEFFSPRHAPEARLSTRLRGPLAAAAREAETQVKQLGRFNDPRGVYARLPLDLRVR